MSNNTYKGKNVFVDTAVSEYVSMGGREAEMTFGIGEFDYTELFGDAREVDTAGDGLPNAGATVNSHSYHQMLCLVRNFETDIAADETLQRGKTYAVMTPETADDIDDVIAAQSDFTVNTDFADDTFFTMDDDAVIGAGSDIVVRHALGSGQTYEIVTVPAEEADKTAIVNNSNLTSTDQLVVGMAFTMTGDYELTGAFTGREIDANAITNRIESVQERSTQRVFRQVLSMQLWKVL